MHPALRALSLVALPLAAAGCGGSSHGNRALATASTATARPARQVSQRTLAEVRQALRGLHTYHLQGTDRSPEGTTTLSGDVTATGDLRMVMGQDRTRADIVLVHQNMYLRGEEAFWVHDRAPAALAARLAGHWVKVPSEKSMRDLVDSVEPGTLAHCLTYGMGTLSDGGLTTLDGRRVRVLAIANDKPGTAPGRLYIAATGPALPIRAVQTGPKRPGGGPVDPRCDDPENPHDSTHSDIRLSRFDTPVHITAPPHPLDLRALAATLRSTSES